MCTSRIFCTMLPAEMKIFLPWVDVSFFLFVGTQSFHRSYREVHSLFPSLGSVSRSTTDFFTLVVTSLVGLLFKVVLSNTPNISYL